MHESAEKRDAGRFARPSRMLVVGLVLLAASIGIARLSFWVVKRFTSAAIRDFESGNKNRVVDATARLESVASEPGRQGKIAWVLGSHDTGQVRFDRSRWLKTGAERMLEAGKMGQ